VKIDIGAAEGPVCKPSNRHKWLLVDLYHTDCVYKCSDCNRQKMDVRCDIRQLPFRNDVFEFVRAGRTLCLIEKTDELHQAIQEVFRVSKDLIEIEDYFDAWNNIMRALDSVSYEIIGVNTQFYEYVKDTEVTFRFKKRAGE